MFKILYLPNATFVYTSSWENNQASFKTREKAIKTIAKHFIFKYGEDCFIYRRGSNLPHPYLGVQKHLFEVIEVPNANST